MLVVIDYILYIFGNTLHLHLNSLRKKKNLHLNSHFNLFILIIYIVKLTVSNLLFSNFFFFFDKS